MRTITAPTFTTGKTLTENNTLRARVNAGDGVKGGERNARHTEKEKEMHFVDKRPSLCQLCLHFCGLKLQIILFFSLKPPSFCSILLLPAASINTFLSPLIFHMSALIFKVFQSPSPHLPQHCPHLTVCKSLSS